jgi:hypothetical protein
MFIRREPEQITEWLVIFTADIRRHWVNRFIPGRRKHVSMLGWSPSAKTWLYLDPELTGTKAFLIPEWCAGEVIDGMTAGCDVLRMTSIVPGIIRVRMLHCCTATARHLLGLPGMGLISLIPDRLYKDCIRAGAIVVRCASDARSPFSHDGNVSTST